METLKNLGNTSNYSFDYNPGVLEAFDNKHPGQRLFCEI
jgi:hypothetical protein